MSPPAPVPVPPAPVAPVAPVLPEPDMLPAEDPVVRAADEAPVPLLVPAPVWPALVEAPLPAASLPAPELCAYATPMASEKTPTDNAVINFFIPDLSS